MYALSDLFKSVGLSPRIKPTILQIDPIMLGRMASHSFIDSTHADRAFLLGWHCSTRVIRSVHVTVNPTLLDRMSLGSRRTLLSLWRWCCREIFWMCSRLATKLCGSSFDVMRHK